MDKKYQYFFSYFFVLIWIIFFLKGFLSIDPDFGWHIRFGEIISTSAIPQSDPFSYTMPSYPFINHEWLTDLATFKVYPSFGQIGLSVIYASVALLSLLLVTPRSKWATIPLLLSATLLISFVGIRPQIISWLFVAIILKIALDDKLWQKWRFGLPFLFVIWANLHGGFVIGLGIIFLIIFSKILQKRFVLSDLLIFLVSILITLINPYGINLWGEIWNSFSDPSLRWTVAEWNPILYRFNIIFLILFALSVFLAIIYRSSISLKQSLLFVILLLMGFSSLRNVPFWVLINIPILSLFFETFFREVKDNKHKLKRFNISYKILTVLMILVCIYHVTSSIKSDLEWPEERIYPVNAISFLKQNPPAGEIFSQYGWGGYLIWKYPDKKTFIDGRMPSWRWNPINHTESSYAYKEYKDIIFYDKDFTQIFDKYNISTVLWSAAREVTKQKKSFIQKLEELGWKKIYQDEVAVIYQK